MHLLVTGFEGFGPVVHNPSEALLAQLPERIRGLRVDRQVLPVDTQAVQSVLRTCYAQEPCAVFHTGVARERSSLSIERIAQNHLRFDLADNAGRTCTSGAVIAGDPKLRASRLPTAAILAAWAHLGINAEASDDAGGYLCNQTFYLGLAWLPASVPTGFIHLAPDEQMSPEGPHVALEAQTRAVARAIEVTLELNQLG